MQVNPLLIRYPAHIKIFKANPIPLPISTEGADATHNHLTTTLNGPAWIDSIWAMC